MSEILIQAGSNPQSLIQAIKYVSINNKDLSFEVIGNPNKLINLSSEKNVKVESEASFNSLESEGQDYLNNLLKLIKDSSFSGLIIQSTDLGSSCGFLKKQSWRLMSLKGFTQKPFFALLCEDFDRAKLHLMIEDSKEFIMQHSNSDSFSYSILLKDSHRVAFKPTLENLISDPSFKGVSSFKDIMSFSGDLLLAQEDDFLPFLEGIKAGIKSYDTIQNKNQRADFRSSIKSHFYSKMASNFRATMNWIFSDLSSVYLIDKKPVIILDESASLTSIISSLNQII